MSVVSLNTHLDMSGSECLNMSDDHPLSNCLQDDASMLKSDCDEQLIISLAFNQVWEICIVSDNVSISVWSMNEYSNIFEYFCPDIDICIVKSNII